MTEAVFEQGAPNQFTLIGIIGDYKLSSYPYSDTGRVGYVGDAFTEDDMYKIALVYHVTVRLPNKDVGPHEPNP